MVRQTSSGMARQGLPRDLLLPFQALFRKTPDRDSNSRHFPWMCAVSDGRPEKIDQVQSKIWSTSEAPKDAQEESRNLGDTLNLAFTDL